MLPDDLLRRAHGALLGVAIGDAADVRYMVYPEASHDSWTRAYAEPELYTWLLSQRRQGNPRV
jgi:hypothetical protein